MVEALIAALAVYDREGRSDHELASLLFPLMSLGFFVDWRITAAHGERAVQIGLRISGLARAQKLRPALGRHVALAIGLGSAAAASAKAKSRNAGFDLRDVIADFCAIVPPTIASWSSSYDTATAERMVQALQPLTLFGPGHVTTLMYNYGLAQVRMVQGREVEARELLEQALARFETRPIKRTLGDIQWRALKGGVLFCLGIMANLEMSNQGPRIARELDGLAIELWSMGADQVRVLHHALRGESVQIKHYFERVERFAIQGGTTWQVEMYWPFVLLPVYVETGDVIAARRSFEQLERRAKHTPTLRPYARLAQAAYFALRGEPARAIALYDEIMPQLVPHRCVAWVMMRCWFSDALCANGEYARAKQLLEETTKALGPEHPYIPRLHIQLQRALALATAGTGDHAEACALLTRLLDKYGAYDQPLIVGLLHKARAEVALLMRDGETFTIHRRETERLFRSTQNPALILQAERMNERAARAGLSQPPIARPNIPKPPSPENFESALLGMSQLTTAGDRQSYALRLLMQYSRATNGYLFSLSTDGLQLTAASSGGLPTPHLNGLLRQRLAQAQAQAARDERAAQRETETEPNTEVPTQLTAHASLTVLERGMRRVRSLNMPAAGAAPASAIAPTSRTLEIAAANSNMTITERAAGNSEQDTERETHRILLLSSLRDGVECIVGGAILQGDDTLVEPDAELVDSLAAALYEDQLQDASSLRLTEHQVALPRRES